MMFTLKFLALLLGGGIFFSLKIFHSSFLLLGLGYNIVLFFLACWDYKLTSSLKQISVWRKYEKNFFVNIPNLITIHIKNYSPKKVHIEIKDEFPQEFNIKEKMPFSLEVLPFGQKKKAYHLIPSLRGEYNFEGINFRILGMLGLIVKQKREKIPEAISVYPDISSARRYALFQRRSLTVSSGIRRFPLRGEGTIFESLREYLPDDDLRWVDWKATAKMHKPISKNFHIERRRNIIIFIDCGRMMGYHIQGKSRLDHAIELASAIGYVALELGDNVGLVVFAEEVKKFLPPQKGMSCFGKILSTLYNVKNEMGDTDYQRAFDHFNGKIKKRSLMLLFTEIRRGIVSDSLLSYVRYLSRRHLPLIASIKDTDLMSKIEKYPKAKEEYFQKAVASKLLFEREKLLGDLAQRGAIILDKAPSQIHLAIIDKYLELKAKEKI